MGGPSTRLRSSRLKDLVEPIVAGLSTGPVDVRAATYEHAALVAASCAAATRSSLLVIAPSGPARDRVQALVSYLLQRGPIPYLFPRWPTGAESPYDDVVEGPFVAAARCRALGIACLSSAPFVMVLDAATAARRVPPFAAFMEGVFRLEVGREVDPVELSVHLVDSGYRRTSTVGEVGEFAVRGGVMDVYSPFSEDPVRIEFDGDEIESIRFFDTATQRSTRQVHDTWLVPAWELPCTPGSMRDAVVRLGDLAAARGVPGTTVAAIETALEQGRTPPGHQGLLPVLHGGMDLLTAYLPDSCLVAVVDPDACTSAADAALDSLAADHHERTSGGASLMAGPADLAAGGAETADAIRSGPRRLLFGTGARRGILGGKGEILQSPDAARATAGGSPVRDRVSSLVRLVRKAETIGTRVLITCPTPREAERARDVLAAEGLDPGTASADGLAEAFRPGTGVRVGVGKVRHPFEVEALGLVIFPSESVFGLKDAVGVRPRSWKASSLGRVQDLAPGDLVIHREHGIGRFIGLEQVEPPGGGPPAECIAIEYKGGDRLLVPVEKAHMLDRYSAPGRETHALDRLGSAAWLRRKRKARKAARRIAGMLKAIYARRLAGHAHAFPPPDADFREFEATFPFETTADQEKAVEEVLDDMTRSTPMDRLVCGDVGFGKTEVAIRAAYRAVMDGKQVAVLVPTTLLAEQHRLTFLARFKDTAVRVESLSRFKGQAGIKRILAELASGSVDVVIGTHRLLSRDVRFRDLGLLVIDEEHRFGVAHKERLREMAATVHTLTLTATPIPRTLHMALSGIRDLSFISTPPRDRLAVRTFVARYSKELVRSAVLRELSRGGQVFIVHNRIEDIYDFASEIQDVVPEARITVAHGRMSAADLESVMAAFIRGDKDVLVCTTIIESGLDIGTANTMLIHNAGSLGLAELYQLRGRIGRASRQAYCYLLVQDPAALSGEARKRIEAIERFSELASGFNLAAMDLEIRGAGDVLGAEQSGHMAAVGYEMFLEMLKEAVEEVSGDAVRERIDPEVRIGVEARIPESYVPDDRLRLRLYRRLAASRSLNDAWTVESELADRFGPPPSQVRSLLSLIRVKLLAGELGLAQLVLKGRRVQMTAVDGRGEALERIETCASTLGVGAPGRAGPGTVVLGPLPEQDGKDGGALQWIEDLLRTAAVDGTKKAGRG